MRLTTVARMDISAGQVHVFETTVAPAPGAHPDGHAASFDQARHAGAGSRPGSWLAVAFAVPPVGLGRIGDAWLSEGRSLALKVPSVTVRGQHNYLIDPAHPDFAGIEVSEPEPLDLDPRITGR